MPPCLRVAVGAPRHPHLRTSRRSASTRAGSTRRACSPTTTRTAAVGAPALERPSPCSTGCISRARINHELSLCSLHHRRCTQMSCTHAPHTNTRTRHAHTRHAYSYTPRTHTPRTHTTHTARVPHQARWRSRSSPSSAASCESGSGRRGRGRALRRPPRAPRSDPRRSRTRRPAGGAT